MPHLNSNSEFIIASDSLMNQKTKKMKRKLFSLNMREKSERRDRIWGNESNFDILISNNAIMLLHIFLLNLCYNFPYRPLFYFPIYPHNKGLGSKLAEMIEEILFN